MNIGPGLLLALVAACGAGAENWRWPENAASVRIDTKVHFIDTDKGGAHDAHVQDDDIPFKEPTETEGFYNRPPGAGRYPVRVEAHRVPYHNDGQAIYPVKKGSKNLVSDGTLDTLQYCKCVATPDCDPRPESASACGYGKYLCCYTGPYNVNPQRGNEFFNEIDDERTMLLPGQENAGRPFPPPPDTEPNGFFGTEFGHESTVNKQAVLVGPDGPNGIVGPQKKPVLVGPGGPTGIVGPTNVDPRPSESAQRGVLVGPGGPTGNIGPYRGRPVLVGPGGPTGIIGPRRSPGILVGPGGPTGIIGPAGYGRQTRPGLLVGPGGPTGVIGPGRQILVGPGGPTGQIGPQGYFGK